MKPRLLIIGATGFVGSRWALAAEHDFDVWRAARHPGDEPRSLAIDITDPASVQWAFAQARPRFVTHAGRPVGHRPLRAGARVGRAINHQGAVHVRGSVPKPARGCCSLRPTRCSTAREASITKLIRPRRPTGTDRPKARAEQATSLGYCPRRTIVRLSLVLGVCALRKWQLLPGKGDWQSAQGNKIISPTYEFRNPIDVGTLCELLVELTPRGTRPASFTSAPATRCRATNWRGRSRCDWAPTLR